MYLRRVRVVCRSFAAVLTNISTVFLLLAPAAKPLGMGLRWSCRGQTCGVMPEAMARISPARPPHRVERPHRRCACQRSARKPLYLSLIKELRALQRVTQTSDHELKCSSEIILNFNFNCKNRSSNGQSKGRYLS
jgi:hypothetical protein